MFETQLLAFENSTAERVIFGVNLLNFEVFSLFKLIQQSHTEIQQNRLQISIFITLTFKSTLGLADCSPHHYNHDVLLHRFHFLKGYPQKWKKKGNIFDHEIFLLDSMIIHSGHFIESLSSKGQHIQQEGRRHLRGKLSLTKSHFQGCEVFLQFFGSCFWSDGVLKILNGSGDGKYISLPIH